MGHWILSTQKSTLSLTVPIEYCSLQEETQNSQSYVGINDLKDFGQNMSGFEFWVQFSIRHAPLIQRKTIQIHY